MLRAWAPHPGGGSPGEEAGPPLAPPPKARSNGLLAPVGEMSPGNGPMTSNSK